MDGARQQLMETIISALISAGATLIVCLITQSVSASKFKTMVEIKLDELTRRVDKHNNLIERTYALEKEVAVLKEEIRQ